MSVADHFFPVAELFDSVVTYVDRKDLVKCLCVSKHFKARILPILYERICLYLYPWDDFPGQSQLCNRLLDTPSLGSHIKNMSICLNSADYVEFKGGGNYYSTLERQPLVNPTLKASVVQVMECGRRIKEVSIDDI